MKTVNTDELRNRCLVATYNADAFAVEDDDVLEEVMEALGEYANRYNKDDDEFAELTAKLDGDVDTYESIYSNGEVTVGILK